MIFFFFFFNDTATTEIYTLSLHDALPIFPTFIETSSVKITCPHRISRPITKCSRTTSGTWNRGLLRSEEHTSELQSRLHLVCRLLLEKKKNISNKSHDDNSIICISTQCIN